MTFTKRLHAADRGTFAAHLLALSSEDRRFRFGRAMSDDALRDYAARIDFGRDAVFGFLADEPPLVGAAHLAIVDGVAELGMSVLAGYRRRGVGSALFQRVSDFARNHFVRTLFLRCLTENAAMLHIARKSGMKIVTGGGAADAYLHLPPPDPGTIASEFLRECLAPFDSNLKAQALASLCLQGPSDPLTRG